jgi:hypothetical protein
VGADVAATDPFCGDEPGVDAADFEATGFGVVLVDPGAVVLPGVAGAFVPGVADGEGFAVEPQAVSGPKTSAPAASEPLTNVRRDTAS